MIVLVVVDYALTCVGYGLCCIVCWCMTCVLWFVVTVVCLLLYVCFQFWVVSSVCLMLECGFVTGELVVLRLVIGGYVLVMWFMFDYCWFVTLLLCLFGCV